jgi:hypothetical protein
MEDESGQNGRFEVVKTEVEAGHHAEVATAAAERPEEVGVLHFVGPDQLAVGGYKLDP